jgi:isopentenyl-diphosphate delta-isomerase
MMAQDMLILVDGEDRVSGAMSKREAHVFGAQTPRGWLHRAFSCFLFDGRGRMLLTRRADSKITFPGVWTNACCSHPLHGRTPEEVDAGDDLSMPGAKHAARRKLRHELGIDPAELPHDDFRFLSRFHYWAADTLTYGKEAPWGEHEVDYILFVQGDVCMEPNPDEVSEYKYVTPDQLRDMLKQDELLWSPWFVGIMDRGGWDWWADLDEALKGNGTFVNSDITYFDPPAEHYASYNLPSHDRSTGVRQLPKEELAEEAAAAERKRLAEEAAEQQRKRLAEEAAKAERKRLA